MAKKVIIIEDDAFLVKVYHPKFVSAGFELLTATNGVDGLELIKKESPDLILLDLIMPEKSGFEVLQELKADPVLSAIPVIVLSNLGQEADMKKALEIGAKDYIVKADTTLKEVIEKSMSILGIKTAA